MSWGIMLQKYLFLNIYRAKIGQFWKLVTAQGTSQIEQACTQMSSGPAKTMPVLILKMLRYHEQGKRIQSPDAIINNGIMHEFSRLTKSMNVLATAANVSPLIGLLGTVWGIMYSFINISQQGNASIDTVAPGIAEALITTIAGLLAAIPAMVGHNYLMSQIYQSQDVLERVAEFAHGMFAGKDA